MDYATVSQRRTRLEQYHNDTIDDLTIETCLIRFGWPFLNNWVMRRSENAAIQGRTVFVVIAFDFLSGESGISQILWS